MSAPRIYYQNRWKFDEVLTKTNLLSFFGTRCIAPRGAGQCVWTTCPRSSPYVTLIKPSSSLKVTHRSFRHICFTSSLEPAPYITQNSSSESLISLSSTLIWTYRFNLLHTAITFHHFFTVSLWAQNVPFQKILSSTLVCFCLSVWSRGSRPFTGLICSSVLCFSSIFLF